MRAESRLVCALSALLWTVFVGSTLVRHWAGTPDGALAWLLLAPVVGAALMAAGLGWELAEVHARRGREIARWREVEAVALAFYFFGFGLVTWRSIWMFFSWDGMYLFPAWLLLAATLLRWHPRWVPCE